MTHWHCQAQKMRTFPYPGLLSLGAISILLTPAACFLSGSSAYGATATGAGHGHFFPAAAMPSGIRGVTIRTSAGRGRARLSPMMQQAPSQRHGQHQPDDARGADELSAELQRELKRRGYQATAAVTWLSEQVSPRPSPDLSPSEVVKCVLVAARLKDWPLRGHGAAVARRFQWEGAMRDAGKTIYVQPQLGDREGAGDDLFEVLDGGFDDFAVDCERQRFKLEDEGGKYAIIEAFIRRRRLTIDESPDKQDPKEGPRSVVKLHWRLRLDPDAGCWLVDRVHVDRECTWLRDIVRPDNF